MSRTLPTVCEHGKTVDWGDFGDFGGKPEACPECEAARPLLVPRELLESLVSSMELEQRIADRLSEVCDGRIWRTHCPDDLERAAAHLAVEQMGLTSTSRSSLSTGMTNDPVRDAYNSDPVPEWLVAALAATRNDQIACTLTREELGSLIWVVRWALEDDQFEYMRGVLAVCEFVLTSFCLKDVEAPGDGGEVTHDSE